MSLKQQEKNNNKKLFLKKYAECLVKKEAVQGITSLPNLYYWLDTDKKFADRVASIERGIVAKAEERLIELLQSADEKIAIKAVEIIFKSKIGKKYSSLSEQSTIELKQSQNDESNIIDIEYVIQS